MGASPMQKLLNHEDTEAQRPLRRLDAMLRKVYAILNMRLPIPDRVALGVANTLHALSGPFLIAAGLVWSYLGVRFVLLAYGLNVPIDTHWSINWILFFFVGGGLAFAAVGAYRTRQYFVCRRRRREHRCEKCGYDLRATPQRCPECGNVVGERK